MILMYSFTNVKVFPEPAAALYIVNDVFAMNCFINKLTIENFFKDTKIVKFEKRLIIIKNNKIMAFELPKLSYAYDALEPNIDARTMEVHHSKHHQGYTNNLNAARSEEHTSELQSRENLVCRLLLEK